MTKKPTPQAPAKIEWDKPASMPMAQPVDVSIKCFGEDDFSKDWVADLITAQALALGLKVKTVGIAGHVLEITGTLK